MIRNIIGPLVGVSLQVERDRGWYINLCILKPLSPKERSIIKEIVADADVPVEIEERAGVARLLPRTTRAAPRT